MHLRIQREACGTSFRESSHYYSSILRTTELKEVDPRSKVVVISIHIRPCVKSCPSFFRLAEFDKKFSSVVAMVHHYSMNR